MFLLLLLLLIGSIWTLPSSDELNQNRNVVSQFRTMINKVTGRSAFDYLGYGCYCGLGGKGIPVDELDECCFLHDQCYDKISTYLQFWNLCSPHLVNYSWDFYQNVVTCKENPETCAYKMCICDKIAAECFARQRYNFAYQGYSQSLCIDYFDE